MDIRTMVPKFILNDRNGYAIAKALERGLHLVEQGVQDGIDCVMDVDKMPEWRLDEMAWETNCLYGYDASIEAKRQWIREAWENQRIRGTRAGLTKYLDGYFTGATIEEWDEFDGAPYHFRVSVNGGISEERYQFLMKIVEYAKNVRSTMDDLSIEKIMTVIAGAPVALAGMMTNTILLTVAETKITGQPEDVSAAVSAPVSFHVDVQGSGITYQWQTLNTPTSSWANTGLNGNKTDTLSFNVGNSSFNGRQYRCIVTDVYGQTITSEAATLMVT